MSAATTRAVVLLRRPAGEPEPADFAIRDLPLPDLADGQLLVRNAYMSVDPSMRGRLETGEKHYTTNFEVGAPLDGSAVGTVVESRAPGIKPGDAVRHRLGWRELAVVEAAAATVVDTGAAPLSAWLGVLGQTGFTAYAGLTRAGRVQPGDTVFVSAAAGAVGIMAGQLARLLGAGRVVGSAGGAAKVGLLTGELGFDAAFDYRDEPAGEALARCAPDGLDVYFDNVGGEQLAAALHAMNVGGRIALCGMMSQFAGGHRPSLDHLMQAILKRITLQGFIVRDHEDLRPEFERQVSGWIADGSLTPVRPSTTGSTKRSRHSWGCSAAGTSARPSSGLTLPTRPAASPQVSAGGRPGAGSR